MRRFLLVLALLLPSLPAAQMAPEAPAEPLARALDAVREDYIDADLRFLASDELGGRDTPSEGLKLAARFLRARLMRLGFEPAGDAAGGEDGSARSFFHTYELERSRLDLEATKAVITAPGIERTLVFGKDYVFPSGEMDGVVREGPVTFIGSGTELDVAALDLKGAWALALDSDMPWRSRRNNVREKGALGLIIMPGPDYDGAPYPRRHGDWVWRARTGSIALPRSAEDEEGEALFPQLYVLREHGVALVGESPELGKTYDARVRDVRMAAEGGERFKAENVAGLWPGNDPKLKNEVLIVSAHYDHVGTREGEIYNGADDNGSGTTGLLAIAEALAANGPLRRSVLLLWVSGEEKGLLGSKAWALAPTLPAGMHAVANVNIDMIGRNAPDSLLITPTSALPQYNALVRMAETVAPHEGFPKLGSCDEYWGRSDQKSFSDHLGIPVMFLFSDVHEDYHKPTDDAEKIDCDKIRRVSRLVVRMLAELQGDQLM